MRNNHLSGRDCTAQRGHRKQKGIAMLILMCMAAITNAATTMQSEMERFLQSLPAGLQHRQAEAIYSALEGDFSALQGVRSGRKPEINLPSGVDTLRMRGDILIFFPKGTDSGKRLPLLLYLHGGGWTFGSINSCSRFCAAVAERGVIVAAADYPLAPEHTSAQITDYIDEALEFVIRRAESLGASATDVSIGGDSSGGNLALSAALRRPGKIKSLVVFYPVADVSQSAAYDIAYSKGYGNDMELMEAFLNSYTRNDEETASSPYLSPIKATDEQLAQLPPTLLIAAECDVLCEQGRLLAARIKKAGGRIERVEFPGTTHLFITVPGQETAFRRSVELTGNFLTKTSSSAN